MRHGVSISLTPTDPRSPHHPPSETIGGIRNPILRRLRHRAPWPSLIVRFAYRHRNPLFGELWFHGLAKM